MDGVKDELQTLIERVDELERALRRAPRSKGSLTESERTMRARAAAQTSWAKTDNRTVRTQPARDAFMRRFENQVDPDGTLPEAERQRRAEMAKKAYFMLLAFKSSRVRRQRRDAQSTSKSEGGNNGG